MKKHSTKNYRLLLVFSALLFSTAIYFLSSSLILGASPGGSTPVTADSQPVTPTSVPETASSETKVEAPTPTTVSTEPPAESTAASEVQDSEVYVVKRGQTLWEIAQDSGLSIQTLMNENQLSSSVLIEGQELVFGR